MGLFFGRSGQISQIPVSQWTTPGNQKDPLWSTGLDSLDRLRENLLSRHARGRLVRNGLALMDQQIPRVGTEIFL
jgi:hypothetical protein